MERLTCRQKREIRKEAVRKKRLEANKKVRLFPENKRGMHVMHFERFLKVFLTPIHFLIYPYRLHGNTKAPKGACVFVGNHYSMFDVFYPVQTTWEGVHYMTKQSVLEKPVLWKWGVRIGAIGVARDGTDARAVMDCIRVLKGGEKLCLFPEGTRNRLENGEFLPFRNGAAMLAVKTKSPIVPFVSIKRQKPFRLTHVVFGDPIELTEYYDKKLTAEDYEVLDNMLRDKMYKLRDDFLARKKKKK